MLVVTYNNNSRSVRCGSIVCAYRLVDATLRIQLLWLQMAVRGHVYPQGVIGICIYITYLYLTLPLPRLAFSAPFKVRRCLSNMDSILSNLSVQMDLPLRQFVYAKKPKSLQIIRFRFNNSINNYNNNYNHNKNDYIYKLTKMTPMVSLHTLHTQ